MYFVIRVCATHPFALILLFIPIFQPLFRVVFSSSRVVARCCIERRSNEKYRRYSFSARAACGYKANTLVGFIIYSHFLQIRGTWRRTFVTSSSRTACKNVRVLYARFAKRTRVERSEGGTSSFCCVITRQRLAEKRVIYHTYRCISYLYCK